MKIDVTKYWTTPPPEASLGLLKWLTRVKSGFRQNKRLRGMGYEERARYYNVYIWELFNILDPALDKACG